MEILTNIKEKTHEHTNDIPINPYQFNDYFYYNRNIQTHLT